MIVSGEMSYALSEPGSPTSRAARGIDGGFANFLNHDKSLDRQQESFALQLESLKSVKRLSRLRYREWVETNAPHLYANVDSTVKNQMAALECEKLRKMRELRRLQESSDANLMQLVLQYFVVLKEELMATREKLRIDSMDTLLQRRQARVLRDLKLFAHHLYHETKSKVSLSVLAPDSTQYKRCKKAVKDNIGQQLLTSHGCSDIKVLAVLKLDHGLISDQLRQAAKIVENGKVKGLFYAVPKGGLQAFAAFGLYAQTSPAELVDEGLPGLFQVPWFWSAQKQQQQQQEYKDGGRHSNKTTNVAETLARGSIAKLHMPSSSSCSEPSVGTTHLPSAFMRFSRSSTPSGFDTLQRKDLEEGTFIALCRVLISRLRTVSGVFSEHDVKEASRLGYDAIFSSQLDEYVLLKPQFVLPEFIMYVQLEGGGGTTAVAEQAKPSEYASNDSASPWLPKALKAPKFTSSKGSNSGRSSTSSGATRRGSTSKSNSDAVVISSELFSRTLGDVLTANEAALLEESVSDLAYGEIEASSPIVLPPPPLHSPSDTSEQSTSSAFLLQKRQIIARIEENLKTAQAKAHKHTKANLG